MAAELKVSGRMTVKRLKENFNNEFGGILRVYNGREKADDNATLATIRRNDDAKGGELVCNGNLTVGSFEKKMLEVFGIKVQVASPDDWVLALDGITLAKLKDIPEKTTKADMESLVGYKRKSVEPIEPGNGGTGFDDDEENDENSSDEEYPLIEKLRDAFIVETDYEVYYDAETADEYKKDQFINNIKAQMTDDEVVVFESLQWEGAEAFTKYLEDCPDDFDLRDMIITAAYCSLWDINIDDDDDTRLYEDKQLYYFNDCMDFHYEYEMDIDFG